MNGIGKYKGFSEYFFPSDVVLLSMVEVVNPLLAIFCVTYFIALGMSLSLEHKRLAEGMTIYRRNPALNRKHECESSVAVIQHYTDTLNPHSHTHTTTN